ARPGGQYAGFGTASSSWHSLAFTAADAEQRWDIDVQVPVGRTLQAVLRDAAGGELARASADAHGRLAFTDLAPEAGTWLLELSGRADEGFMRTLRVESVGVRVEGEEAEPNNDWRRANRVDVGRPLSGRM